MEFSIVLPVYNVEKELPVCLESVFSQSFSDYEVVAVDDGSTDSSLKILEEYAAEHANLKVIHQENKGLGGARNTGIHESSGEYLVLVDSDDYIDHDTLHIFHQYLLANDLDMLMFDAYRVNDTGIIIDTITNKHYEEEFTLVSKREALVFEPTGCTKVYRRHLFKSNDVLFPEKLWYEDLATVPKLILHAANIGYLKQPLYYYVQRGGSITHSKNTKRMMEIITAFSSVIEYYKSRNAFEEYHDELEWNCFLHVNYYSAFRLLTSGYNITEMKELYGFSHELFPKMEHNKYVVKESGARDMMGLILNRQYLSFYLKTGLISSIYDVYQAIKRVFAGADK